MRRPIKKRKAIGKVDQFINYTMHDGKRTIASRIVREALAHAGKEASQEPLELFEAAIRNVGPLVEVRSRRIGGATYQVPREVRPERRTALAFRWILDAARAKKGLPMPRRLAAELLSASKNEGEAVKKRENTHKMAEANRAFAHFAW